MDLIDELAGLIKALNDAGVRYALCGGLAMAVHGHPRATQDIDLLIPEEELAKIQQVAETVGFWIPSGRMPFKAKTPLAMDIYRVSKAVGSILIPLDMIIVSPALQQVWDSRMELPLGTIHCPVVSKEGLIRMKTIAGRLRDLADIESLTGAGDES